MAKTKIGVILSGCGVHDGSEIHEAVLTLLALDRAGVEAACFAPNVPQRDVVNHLTGEPAKEGRNVLVESARIARGKIRDVKEAKASELDGLVLPGGFGAAKNLSDFAVAGEEAKAQPDVARLLAAMLKAKKPVAAICIAPAVLAAVLRDAGLHGTLTIGTDRGTARKLEAMGARHADCPVEEFRVDEELRLITTPAYMLAGRISEAAAGIERTVAELVRLARQPVHA
jgi:enhancing lycopene biosynthesis protein 2